MNLDDELDEVLVPGTHIFIPRTRNMSLPSTPGCRCKIEYRPESDGYYVTLCEQHGPKHDKETTERTQDREPAAQATPTQDQPQVDPIGWASYHHHPGREARQVNAIQISMRLDSDTESRIINFEGMCSLTEGLMATTLANRLESVPEGDKISAEEHIRAWFRTVRQMAVAQWIVADVKVEVTKS